jgi:MoaA/NifB/PqqE/SkfB family radical SAM enzyme
VKQQASNELSKRLELKTHAKRLAIPPFDKCRMAIEITNICNHKCIFCPSEILTRKKRFINEDLCYRIIREGYELGIREIAFHILGEPFLNDNLPNYVRVAKKLGYTYAYLTSNGSLATPEKIKSVIDAGLDSIKFSINAATRENYKSTHGKDDFEKVKNNLIACYEYRKTANKNFKIFTSFVVTNQTIGEIELFKKEFADYVDSIAFYKAATRSGAMPENKLRSDKINADFNYKVLECSQPFNAIYVSCEGTLIMLYGSSLKFGLGGSSTTLLKRSLDFQ